jgi:hypothetical protein
MKPHIVADGERRLRRSPELKAHLHALREAIRARHAGELAAAGLFGRLVLRWQMAAEYRRERRKLEPAPGSLYGRRQVP